MVDRSSSAVALLARLGFAEPERSAGLLRDPALLRLLAPQAAATDDAIESTRPTRTSIAEGLAAAADPDLAALGLVRLTEAVLGMPPCLLYTSDAADE